MSVGETRVQFEKRGFAQGVAWACQVLLTHFGREKLALDLLSESGLTIDQLDDAGADEYDLAPIRAALNPPAEADLALLASIAEEQEENGLGLHLLFASEARIREIEQHEALGLVDASTDPRYAALTDAGREALEAGRG